MEIKDLADRIGLIYGDSRLTNLEDIRFWPEQMIIPTNIDSDYVGEKKRYQVKIAEYLAEEYGCLVKEVSYSTMYVSRMRISFIFKINSLEIAYNMAGSIAELLLKFDNAVAWVERNEPDIINQAKVAAGIAAIE